MAVIVDRGIPAAPVAISSRRVSDTPPRHHESHERTTAADREHQRRATRELEARRGDPRDRAEGPGRGPGRARGRSPPGRGMSAMSTARAEKLWRDEDLA